MAREVPQHSRPGSSIKPPKGSARAWALSEGYTFEWNEDEDAEGYGDTPVEWVAMWGPDGSTLVHSRSGIPDVGHEEEAAIEERLAKQIRSGEEPNEYLLGLQANPEPEDPDSQLARKLTV